MADHPKCCAEMKTDQIYTCEKCGLELKVVKECGCGDDHPCCTQEGHCVYVCCGGPLTLKAD